MTFSGAVDLSLSSKVEIVLILVPMFPLSFRHRRFAPVQVIASCADFTVSPGQKTSKTLL
jgi:hypothetical protein